MKEIDYVYLNEDELEKIVYEKIKKSGLSVDDSLELAKHLTYADARGVHSHGSIRVKYYYKRIIDGGNNITPNYEFKKTGPCSGVFEADNGIGFSAVKKGMEHAIKLAKENGLGVVGVRNIDHSGTMAYYLRMAAQENLVAITMCQSDPGVVPFGGSEVYFGTNPFGFTAPQSNGEPIMLDMATSVQAWGKILTAKNNGESIPLGWGLDKDGNDTTDPSEVTAVLPAAGPKGYGLMMMIDILAGSMLGLSFGKHVTDGTIGFDKGRDLGQFIMVINPAFYTKEDVFLSNVTQMINEIHEIKPVPGVDKVLVPGENSQLKYEEYKKTGIPIPKNIYDYLTI